ncbi:AMP-binding protein [Candidatus Woesearchaeota archaeon]|nr:AMP-binding protein [Candidatus Woesearchaeota archaeon]
MPQKEVKSLAELIEIFLNNKEEVLFSYKKGYRTFTLNGKELKYKINKIRSFFYYKKIKKGDKIIILSRDYLEWISVYFASILSGMIVVPLDIFTDKSLLQKIQKQVNAKAIFQDKGLVYTKIKTYYLDELEEKLEDIKVSKNLEVKIYPDDILEIMYTSGTTGQPKGVILTHANIVAGVNSAIKSVPLKLKLRMLNLLPLSHIYGQVYGLFTSMYFGYRIYFIDTIQSKKIISFIKIKKINIMILVPSILDSLKKELEGKSLLKSLGIQFRIIGVGGASLETELEKWWNHHLISVVQGYGLTETSSVASVNIPFFTKIGSAGKIAKDTNIKLNKDNEILIKGPNVTSGYFLDEEKTKQSFKDGWFKTGDIGYLKNGYLYIKERKKDVIVKASGLKVYPIDVENVLNNINGVEESCVIEKNKGVHAIFILNKKIDPLDIVKIANKTLLNHQKISSFFVWPDTEFPKTHTGKIKKYLVRREMGKLEAKRHFYEDKLFEIIKDVIKPTQKILLVSKLTDLGMDSIKRIELISEIEKKCNIEIDEIKINQNTKVSDLKNLLKEKSVEKISFKSWHLNKISQILRYLFQRILFFPLVNIFTKTEYYGLENIKNIKICIFASNHQSGIDGHIIIKKLKLKTAIAVSDYFFAFGEGKLSKPTRKLLGYFLALFYNAYPFGENIGLNKSMEFTGEMLDKGFSIIIFPEAHRTPDGKIYEFKIGIGFLSLNMNVPIVPVKISGMFEVLPATRNYPKFGKSLVKFGKPIYANDIKKMSYLDATNLIEKKVREL